MFEKRSKHIVIILIVLASIVTYTLFDRMVISRKDYFYARYTDKEFIELMDDLLAGNAFRIDGNGIVIDETLLKEKGLDADTEARVRKQVPFLFIKKEQIQFDSRSASIVNNRTFNEERVIRGSFLDRNGVVLAKSIVNEKIWNQKREYLYGPEFYPVIGHWTPIYGKRYLEKEMDTYLMGKSHWPVYRESSESLRKMKVGDNISLTIDSKVQKRAYDMMNNKRGAVVVLNIKTGEILTAVSTPSFDPNTMDRKKWRDTFRDNTVRSYENRAFSALYPPGSIFKAVVSSAWLEADLNDNIERDYHADCKGKKKNKYRISDIHIHGDVGLDEAFAKSCNVYFSEIGVVLGQNIYDYAERFGFNRDIDLLPQFKKNHYVTEKSLAFSWYEYSDGNREIKNYDEVNFRRNPKIVAQGAIGQNLITATPIQMAAVAQAIANKGVMLNPYIVKEITNGKGENIFSSRPVNMGRVIKKSTANKLKKLMVQVMKSGTGEDVKKMYFENNTYTTKLRDPKCLKRRTGFLWINTECQVVEVAGKTGTAEVGDRNRNGKIEKDERPHSWFIGFAPADDPEVAIAVIAENRGFGSVTAAPIAVEVMVEALNSLATDLHR